MIATDFDGARHDAAAVSTSAAVRSRATGMEVSHMARRPFGYEGERYGDEGQRSRMGRSDWDDERRYRSRREDDDRGFFERGADRVRSWLGDEEAERRRRLDQRDEDRYDRGESDYGYRTDSYRTDSYGTGAGSSGSERRRGDLESRESWGSRSGEDAGRHTRSGRTFAQPRTREDFDWSGRDADERRDWSSAETSRTSRSSGRSTPISWSYTEWWVIPGPHAGRGPRGYQRSDERIREDVCERLTQHGEIDARDIDVRVANGEVTLQGTVHNRDDKRRAEDVAESVSGVREVQNQLRVSGSLFGSDDRTTGQTQQSIDRSTGSDRAAGKPASV